MSPPVGSSPQGDKKCDQGMFLDQKNVGDLMIALQGFVEKKIIDSDFAPTEDKIEALADAISAVEYFIDSLGGQSAGASEAIALAEESIQHLLS